MRFFPNITKYLIYYLLIQCFFSCDNGDGLFGHSNTKEEAQMNNSDFNLFLPNEYGYKLLDGSFLQIDTAWSEISFTYKNGEKVTDPFYGYNFSIPYKYDGGKEFKFIFRLADTSNILFTNGMNPDICFLRPRKLYDTINVLLEQKNQDTALGWLYPIITDTITFKRIIK